MEHMSIEKIDNNCIIIKLFDYHKVKNVIRFHIYLQKSNLNVLNLSEDILKNKFIEWSSRNLHFDHFSCYLCSGCISKIDEYPIKIMNSYFYIYNPKINIYSKINFDYEKEKCNSCGVELYLSESDYSICFN